MADDFDTFAARFKALHAEYFPTPMSHPGADELAVAPPSSVDTSQGRIESGTSSPLNLNAGTGTTAKPATQPRTWEEVEIRFVSEERVQITIGDETETRNYAEFGFEDGRNKMPIRAWAVFRSLAEAGGTMRRVQNGPKGVQLEKRMQEIRTILAKRFRLDTNPLPFVKGIGYRAGFKISCGPSFNS